MSAAATAAGFLYAHGRLPASDLDGQAAAERPRHAAEPRSSRSLERKVVPWQGRSEPVPWQDRSEPVKQVRTPRIEYRKRRYPLPSAA
jgi:hypothetical protein